MKARSWDFSCRRRSWRQQVLLFADFAADFLLVLGRGVGTYAAGGGMWKDPVDSRLSSVQLGDAYGAEIPDLLWVLW